MRRSTATAVACASLLLLLAGHVRPALAVDVPGDYPSIQAALDAGATEILVAEGTYHETLLVTHDVTLLPAPPASWSDPIPVPKVDGMLLQQTWELDNVYVRGFHFTGPVLLNDFEVNATIESCRLDGGFATPSSPVFVHLNIRNCVILGDLFSHAYWPQITNNVVVGGGITAWSNGGGSVNGNVIIGPAAVGIGTPSGDVGTSVYNNIIRNVQDGIVARLGGADSNLVEDCAGTAYTAIGSASFYHNVARRCGGNGITLAGSGTAVGNTVESVGLDGIHVSSSFAPVRDNIVSHSGNHGIFATAGAAIHGNRVLSAGGDGIHAEHGDGAWGNVVGRCAGTGIVSPDLHHNTSYLNGGSGYRATDGYLDSLTHNIAYGNKGFGLVWAGSGSPVLACNDWYGNTAGDVSGTNPGETDKYDYPLFCDLAQDDASLSAVSPLLDSADCGLIGALGQGCTEPAAVPPPAATLAPMSFTAMPNPAKGAVWFAWPGTNGAGRMEVYDVTGAVRWSRDLDGGLASLSWDAKDHQGQRLPAGVYYARLNSAGTVATARFVLVP